MMYDALAKISNTASKKKDGVYTIRRNTFYVVCNGSIVAYCEYDGPNWGIYQVAYGLSSKVGEIVNEFDIRSKLKEWLELYKL